MKKEKDNLTFCEKLKQNLKFKNKSKHSKNGKSNIRTSERTIQPRGKK